MNKELNKKLCEKLGIKPKYQTIISDIEFEQVEFEEEIFPDLIDNNNNFVRLLEKDIKQLFDEETTVLNLLLTEYSLDPFYRKKDFIEKLIDYIDNPCDNADIEFIKQQIQSIEFEY